MGRDGGGGCVGEGEGGAFHRHSVICGLFPTHSLLRVICGKYCCVYFRWHIFCGDVYFSLSAQRPSIACDCDDGI